MEKLSNRDRVAASIATRGCHQFHNTKGIDLANSTPGDTMMPGRNDLGALPAMLLLGLFVFTPFVLLLRVSFYATASGRGFYEQETWTFHQYETIFDSHSLSITELTIEVALIVTALSVLLSYAFAMLVQSLKRGWQYVIIIMVMVPKSAGMLLVVFGLQRLLVRGYYATIVAEVYLIFPYCFLVQWLQLQKLDAGWIRAAQGLGASPWQIFRRVRFPLAIPGMILAAELSLIWGIGAFLGPMFLGGPEQMTLSVELYRQAFEYGRWPRAAAFGVELLVLTLVLLVALAQRKPKPR